jgi:hypothetical protein
MVTAVKTFRKIVFFDTTYIGLVDTANGNTVEINLGAGNVFKEFEMYAIP